MKRLNLKKLLNALKILAPLLLIIIAAAFFRGYKLPVRASFDADQEEIALRAKDILSGHLVLLGPKTSLGGFSIGPGFSYVWGFFSLFVKGDPIAGAYASIFLGILFLIGIFFFTKKIFSEKIAIIISIIIAVSVNFIQWDQSPWAPSLFYFSELIILYGAYISNKDKLGLILLAFGIGLGFQSHFAVFLLIPPVIIYLIFYRPIIERKNLFYSTLILIASVFPVILFDLFHKFVNFHRLLSVFSLGGSGVAPSKIKLLWTLASNSAYILWTHLPAIFVYAIFSVVLIFSFYGIYKNKKLRSLLILSSLLIFTPFLLFLFYKSNFSEYYLMTAVVPFLILMGYTFSIIKYNLIIFPILGIIFFLNWGSFVRIVRPINLYAKETIVQKIVELGGKNGYGVSFSMDPAYNFGYSYLFSYYGASPNTPPLKNQKKIFTILTPPYYKGLVPMEIIDSIGLRWEGI